ncbi:uncharacterized protein [Arachis hypogaea]|nr:Extra-large guanine nucleotide-binding protein [Arachis hypogaea]
MGDDQKMKKVMHNHGSSSTRPRIMELEELYQGIPDESVNLTFQDLANVHHNNSVSPEKRSNSIITPTTTNPFVSPNSSPPMSKLPSLDFSKGLQATNNNNHHHHGDDDSSSWGHFGHHQHHDIEVGDHRVVHKNNGHHHHHHNHNQFSHASDYSMGYDSMMMSGVSGSGKGGGGRRRPGIPHSKICTVCSNYIYMLRTRCLVCGRVYCRQCVEIGMGEMTEGRKCIECLGLRFSQRYIERAGMLGCCSWRYPSTLKQTELKWAEKGPRRSGQRGYSHHHGLPPSRTPTPTHSNEPSFVMSASYSPFSSHHHLPL